jgi:phosphotransferase system enzyme I (PtsP)
VRSGLTAEAAVERVRSEHRARLGQARDPYLRERLHDLEDLNDRLLRHLSGDVHAVRELPDDAILIARNLGPADLLEYDRTKLKGILLEEGSAASHAGIVARALDIPCVGRLAGPARPGQRRRPRGRRRRDRRGLAAAAHRRGQGHAGPDGGPRPAQGRVRPLRDTPAFTKDGAKITLLMNAGLAVDLDILAETGAEGIGLFRTEFQFMVAEEMPRLEAQTALYEKVLEAAGGLPVTFRTLDLGGDKLLPYMEGARGQSGPGLARRPHGPGPSGPAAHADPRPDQGRRRPAAAVMFPLVANVDEFRAARSFVDQEVAWAQKRGRPRRPAWTSGR